MALSIRLARSGDLDALLALMQRLYEEDGIASFEGDAHQKATRDLLAAPDAGHIYAVEEQEVLIGYAVLTWGYSLEFGGRYGLLDEIYIAPDRRGQGIGAKILKTIGSACRERGVRALRLEVERANTSAQRFYQHQGFREERRHLFTKWLDE